MKKHGARQVRGVGVHVGGEEVAIPWTDAWAEEVVLVLLVLLKKGQIFYCLTRGGRSYFVLLVLLKKGQILSCLTRGGRSYLSFGPAQKRCLVLPFRCFAVFLPVKWQEKRSNFVLFEKQQKRQTWKMV